MSDISNSSTNMDTNNWNKEQTYVMIQAYREHPCLYDPRDSNFTNKIKRNVSYNAILEAVKDVKENLTFAGVKRKIKTLQCQLSKERMKIAKLQKNGDAERYVPTLWCYNELSFLRHLSETNESSSMNVDLVEVSLLLKLNEVNVY